MLVINSPLNRALKYDRVTCPWLIIIVFFGHDSFPSSMPPRVSGPRATQRPLSAIFIGSAAPAVGTNPLPDLPEPPSPSGSSVGSGLPSPPATNSTGGSSTSDPATISHHRPMSTSATTPSPGSSRSSSRLSVNDNKQTMRLMIAGGAANESILQRARSLQQRNRIVSRPFLFSFFKRSCSCSSSTSLPAIRCPQIQPRSSPAQRQSARATASSSLPPPRPGLAPAKSASPLHPPPLTKHAAVPPQALHDARGSPWSASAILTMTTLPIPNTIIMTTNDIKSALQEIEYETIVLCPPTV